MSTDTQIQDDSEVLNGLEFDPPCQARERLRILGVTVYVWPRCVRKAIWVAMFPCCGFTLFTCDPHRRTPSEFPHCGHPWRSHHLIWSRI
ncbi:hypothetical protein SEA_SCOOBYDOOBYDOO_197 [Mycobacterium phage ScoobyDoobyDoo]|nr:hypothetical protein SEA_SCOOBYDOOBYDOO_197 [Mycobacterium phage ScoobyDoobyDoo]